MAMTFDEAVAFVTGPGGPLELREQDVLGQPLPVFAVTPPSLRSLWDTLRARPDDVYLVYEDERWTFPEVVARIDALAHALVHQLGVRKGDRVAIGMRNYPEWVVAFGAISSIGAVVVSLNAWWTGPEMEFGLTDSGATVLVSDRQRVDRIGGRIVDLGVRGLAVRAEGDLPAGWEHLGDVVVPGSPMPEVAIDPDDDATILYTSGTTGKPKGAVSTHRAVLSGLLGFACRNVVEAMRRDAPEGEQPTTPATCFILAVPLFHVTGCIPVMLGSALGGNRLVIMHKWDPERALELIERERVTNFIGVPTMAQDLLASPDFATRDTSSLQNVGGGGAPMPPELVHRIEGNFHGARPQLGYGMTETNAYGPGNTGDDYIRKPASTGPRRPDHAGEGARPVGRRAARPARSARSASAAPT